MFGRLLLLFIAVPLVELALLIEIGRRIGLWPTVAIVLVTGGLGASLSRWQGLRIINRIRKEVWAGKIPGEALLNGMLVLIAAAFLLTPGVLTDLLGFALLIPPARAPIRRWLQRRFGDWIKTHKVRIETGWSRRTGDGGGGEDGVIDVDV